MSQDYQGPAFNQGRKKRQFKGKHPVGWKEAKPLDLERPAFQTKNSSTDPNKFQQSMQDRLQEPVEETGESSDPSYMIPFLKASERALNPEKLQARMAEENLLANRPHKGYNVSLSKEKRLANRALKAEEERLAADSMATAGKNSQPSSEKAKEDYWQVDRFILQRLAKDRDSFLLFDKGE
mgnify:CR=1 FL=1